MIEARRRRGRIDPELLRNLVNGAEIARRAGVQRSAVSNWSVRFPGFPEPVIRLLYDWREVEVWLRGTDRYPITGKGKALTERTLIPAVGNPVDDHRQPRRSWRP